MNLEARTCQNCKGDFVVEPEDFQFYEKIKVPAPTFCSGCRLQRRLAWRNERALYRRNCDLCDKETISMYEEKTSFPVYCHECWLSDKWNPLDYGREYDFSQPFFDQFQSLINSVPRSALYQRSSTSSPYANLIGESKNVYLSYSAVQTEDVFYSKSVDRSRKIFDSISVADSENCFGNIYSDRNFNSHFLEYSNNCLDSWFLFDCANCNNCALSSNLRNREYYFRNEPYSKKEYFEKLKELNLGSFVGLEKAKNDFNQLKLEAIHKYGDILKCVNSNGDNLYAAKNARVCFDSYDVEDCTYTFRVFDLKDSFDACFTGESAELVYEYISGGLNNYNVKFSTFAFSALKDSFYADYCTSSSDIFGCIGLRSKKFCILNKQYSEDEYRRLVPKIIDQMDAVPFQGRNGRVYRYGEFFPIELSTFAYNETIAQEYFPLTREKAKEMGYEWKDSQGREYAVDIQPQDLPDRVDDVSEDALKKIIGCFHRGECNHQCTYRFRLVSDEIQIHRSINLAFPRLCPNCRHYERLKFTNPLKLWHRQCMCDYEVYKNSTKHSHHPSGRCLNEFETSYAPDRKEVVYCEACYNAEVV